MPEGESFEFWWHLAPEGAAAFCPGGSVHLGSSDALGSLVWYHPAQQIKMNFLLLFFGSPPWPCRTGELVLLIIFFPVCPLPNHCGSNNVGREFGVARPILKPSAFAIWVLGHQAGWR